MPNLRLCYGSVRPEPFPDAPRAVTVTLAVQEALDNAFSNCFAGPDEPAPELPYVRDQQAGAGILVGNGWKARTGYNFYLHASTLFTLTGKQRFRFREYELFTALKVATQRLGQRGQSETGANRRGRMTARKNR